MRMRPIVGPVPDSGVHPAGGMDEIATQLAAGGVAVLTGAGISTDSEIPSMHPQHGANMDNGGPVAGTVRT
ncbi:hypothetical protein [Streptomyces anandii]|uniref:hypothetical protein n=1 Tax=Streptomyces anandii TaxID=285454 RepID=UPI0037ADF5BD